MTTSIAVLGAGSFGSALAVHLARREFDVRLWGRDAAQLQAMAEARENTRYLPGCKFPPALLPQPDLRAALVGADHVLMAVPSHALHATLRAIQPLLTARQGVILACKGLEPDTGKLAHEVAHDVLGQSCHLAVLSGPTFAREVGMGLPTAVTVASREREYAASVVRAFHGLGFRAYYTDDVVGVEVGGSVKNVLAIGVAIADGLGLGANTRAALITRGLAEIMRFGEALGGNRDTFMGLAGLGDLVLTCTDDQSRNRRFGLLLAKGKSIDEARAEIRQVVEGVRVAPEVLRRARSLGVDMPIAEQVVEVLAQRATPLDAVRRLATRPPKAEGD